MGGRQRLGPRRRAAPPAARRRAFLVLSSVRGGSDEPRPAAAEAILTVVLALAFSSFVFSVLDVAVIRGGLRCDLDRHRVSRWPPPSALAGPPHRATTASPPFSTRSRHARRRVVGFRSGWGVGPGWKIAAGAGPQTGTFILLRSGVALTWLLTLAGALSVSRRFPDGGARVSFATAALMLAGHAPSGRCTVPSGCIAAQCVREVAGRRDRAASSGRRRRDFVGLLHAQPTSLETSTSRRRT